jgi:hypothetical protein
VLLSNSGSRQSPNPNRLILLAALLVMVGVHLREMLPLLRQVVLRENRLDRAGWLASSAVDALDRVDIEHLGALKIGFVLARMYAIHRANVDASGVFRTDAGFGYYVCHKSSLA